MRELAKPFCGILIAAVDNLVRTERFGHCQPILQYINRYNAGSASFADEHAGCPHWTDTKDRQSRGPGYSQPFLRGVLGPDHVGHDRARLEGKFIRQPETVDRRRDKIVCVTAIEVEAETLELGTQHAKAAMAPLAVPAADGKVNRHAVANLNSIRSWAKLNYFPSRFVTRDD